MSNTITTTTIIHVSRCPICSKEGQRKVVEKLPKGGLYVRFIHNDKSLHEWAEHNTSGDADTMKIRRDPKRMRCPLPDCGKIGVINKFNPDDAKPWVYEYLIVHEAIKGKWGKGKSKVRRRKRHYIRVPEQRDKILKKLKLFIPHPNEGLERYIEK